MSHFYVCAFLGKYRLREIFDFLQVCSNVQGTSWVKVAFQTSRILGFWDFGVSGVYEIQNVKPRFVMPHFK